jgi:WhiB family redox-sensing transcriptional regulator
VVLTRYRTQGETDGAIVATRVRRADMRITIASETEAEVHSWQDFANCLGVDPDLFFPERGASTREAKEVCRGCVVREDCLEYALANGEKFGIWGGMSERERRRIRRQRALARRAAAGATA